MRRYPIGCEVLDAGAHFRLWAPRSRSVDVVVEAAAAVQDYPLQSEGNGYFSGYAPAPPGTRYRFRLDGGADAFPDPASRFQPEGPFGASMVVDHRFVWSDRDWRGLRLRQQVFYEMHVGAFTPEGTWSAAAEQLPELASLGITCVELMPVADFPGRWGWGYDGVNLFAPTRLYGTPDDFRRFVDRAHSLGMGVILDVVYNHFGPAGNFLKNLTPDYFTDEYSSEWGEGINFAGPNHAGVREFFLVNAMYWIGEFHLDGLRLDATQSIHDTRSPHILQEIGEAVRKAAGGSETILVAENESQDTTLLRPADTGGYGLDGAWNDDFHHSAMVALTGRREAYYTDYNGSAQEILSSLKRGYLFQGQHYAWQKKQRGTAALDLSPERFVTYLQNHDQVANSLRGERGHRLTSPGRWRAMTAVLLLGPGTPLLFQGQEFSSHTPFLYFADHDGELSEIVAKGRVEFLSQFPSIAGASPAADEAALRDAFARCLLDFEDRRRNAPVYRLHRELLRIRRADPSIGREEPVFDGAVLHDRVFALRYLEPEDRLLIVNLGPDFAPPSISEPLLASPRGRQWQVILSTEDAEFGGGGVYNPCEEGRWTIPGECAVLLGPSGEAA